MFARSIPVRRVRRWQHINSPRHHQTRQRLSAENNPPEKGAGVSHFHPTPTADGEDAGQIKRFWEGHQQCGLQEEIDHVCL